MYTRVCATTTKPCAIIYTPRPVSHSSVFISLSLSLYVALAFFVWQIVNARSRALLCEKFTLRVAFDVPARVLLREHEKRKKYIWSPEPTISASAIFNTHRSLCNELSRN